MNWLVYICICNIIYYHAYTYTCAQNRPSFRLLFYWFSKVEFPIPQTFAGWIRIKMLGILISTQVNQVNQVNQLLKVEFMHHGPWNLMNSSFYPWIHGVFFVPNRAPVTRRPGEVRRRRNGCGIWTKPEAWRSARISGRCGVLGLEGAGTDFAKLLGVPKTRILIWILLLLLLWLLLLWWWLLLLW